MRFFELFFLFSPSWQFQRLSPHQFINGASLWQSKIHFNLNHQVGSSRKFGLNITPRNDEIKEIFDIPAGLLCAEFYKKHYGLGSNRLYQFRINSMVFKSTFSSLRGINRR